MIILNNYKDLLPFQKIIPRTIKDEMNKIEYRFEKDGVLQDVIFNFNAVLMCSTVERQNLSRKYYDSFFNITAKNITFNNNIICDDITCESLICNNKLVRCKNVDATKEVRCRNFFCNSLRCFSVNASRLSVEHIRCFGLKAKSLSFWGRSFFNVTAEHIEM